MVQVEVPVTQITTFRMDGESVGGSRYRPPNGVATAVNSRFKRAISHHIVT